MRALHATGRAGEALSLARRAEQAARRNGRELPEPVQRALSDVHGDQPPPTPSPAGAAPGVAVPAVAVPGVAAPAVAVPGAAAPYQLPADTSHFTGRAAELARLRAVWPDGGGAPAAQAVYVVDGMAGVGKTALVVHAAHQLAGRFPEGNLFLDLRGFTPRTRPIPPEKALDILLRGLGVAAQQVPRDLAARSALYRSRLARSRMLIVLDNARDEAQVRPLLPGTASCLVLITSRRRLSGLDDATPLTLDTLKPAEAAELFYAVASERAAGDRRVIDEIVRICGELPLAIRIAAARLRTSRTMRPAALLGFLRTGRADRQLAGLDDGERSVAAAFAVSYQHLADEQRHAFRLLGAHPGPTLDGYAAAALLDTSLDHAQQVLDALEQVNLISQPTPGRYRYHDLLRAYASTAPAADGAVPDQGPALCRLLAHYSHTAAIAVAAVYAGDAQGRPRLTNPSTPVPPLAGDPGRAASWLADEMPNLLAVASYAAVSGQPRYVRYLSAVLARFLSTRARSTDAGTLHGLALEAALAGGDALGELAARLALGRTDQLAGNHRPAAEHYRRALQLAEVLDHPRGQVEALTGLGHAARLAGQERQALQLFRRAAELAARHHHVRGEIEARHGIGQLHRTAGRPRPAAEQYATAHCLAHPTTPGRAEPG
jgi:tetratricopeptide (TPR) repeat protein